MRIDREYVHPTLWAAMDKYEYGFMINSSETSVDAYNAHQKIWWKEYGKGCGLCILSYTVICGLAAYLTKSLQSPLIFFVAIVGCFLHALWAFLQNRRIATPDELEALLPALDLTQNQLLYTHVLIGLYRQNIEETLRNEMLKELFMLMEDDQHLTKAREQVEASIANADPEEFEAEIRELEEKVAAAKDEIARDTYLHGLQLAKDRAKVVEQHRPILERIDAQQEVVRQTLLTLRSDVSRSTRPLQAPSDLITVGIRSNLMQVRNHAHEIDRALEELNQSL